MILPLSGDSNSMVSGIAHVAREASIDFWLYYTVIMITILSIGSICFSGPEPPVHEKTVHRKVHSTNKQQ